jgi:hypothetical protein
MGVLGFVAAKVAVYFGIWLKLGIKKQKAFAEAKAFVWT